MTKLEGSTCRNRNLPQCIAQCFRFRLFFVPDAFVVIVILVVILIIHCSFLFLQFIWHSPTFFSKNILSNFSLLFFPITICFFPFLLSCEALSLFRFVSNYRPDWMANIRFEMKIRVIWSRSFMACSLFLNEHLNS